MKNVTDETKMNVESGRTIPEIISGYRKQLAQMEKEVSFLVRDRDIRGEILKFEREHAKVIDGKPEWLLSEDYMALIVKQKELAHEIQMIQLMDRLSQTETRIVKIKSEITRLGRNGVPTQVLKKSDLPKLGIVEKSEPAMRDLVNKEK